MSTARQAAEQSKVTLGLADRFSRPSDRDYFLDPPSSYSRYARRGSDPATGSETDPLSRYIRLDVQISRLMDEDTLAPHTLRQRLFSIQPGRVNTRTRPYNSMITRLETILGPADAPAVPAPIQPGPAITVQVVPAPAAVIRAAANPAPLVAPQANPAPANAAPANAGVVNPVPIAAPVNAAPVNAAPVNAAQVRLRRPFRRHSS